MRDLYKTKDIWVAMCLVVLGEKLQTVSYDPVIEKVFFVFKTPVSKGRAIEAAFASGDRRLVLPVVELHKAYEFLHRWRVIVSNARSELSLQEMADSLQELTEKTQRPAPQTLDEAIKILQEETENNE